MTEDRDPVLQALFAGAEEELPGEAFTAQVLERAARRQHHAVLAWAGVGVVLTISVVLFAGPLLSAILLLTQALTVSLFELKEGWAVLLLGPFNNVATLLGLAIIFMRTAYRKIFRS